MSSCSEPEPRDPTYHSTDYNLPNDSYELTRLEDQATALVEMMHNAPIHAPLHTPNLLIDIGCGTGIQTCALGTTYPAARIYGIDLSPVPPRDDACPKPPNVQYIQGDFRALAERDARLGAGEVDYAFSRLLIHGITDWQGYVGDVARLLRPGGWAEMQEYVQDWYVDGELVSEQWPWLRAIRQQAESKGADYDCGRNIKGYMQKAGLVDVRQVEYRVPYGTWMVRERPETGRIGRHTAREYGTLYHHGIERILEGAGYERREIEEFQAQAKRDLGAEEGKDVPFVVTVGRKPEK
ncbi:MAG: hypothetical protein Q9195_003002 [Heterodermia aff. obscurata]